MPIRQFDQMSDDELRRSFLILGSTFFQWNSGSNIPNILRHLSERVETLQGRAKDATEVIESFRDTVKEASDSSDKLASALNRFTRWLVIVGVIALVLQAVSMGWAAWAHFHP